MINKFQLIKENVVDSITNIIIYIFIIDWILVLYVYNYILYTYNIWIERYDISYPIDKNNTLKRQQTTYDNGQDDVLTIKQG